MKQLLLAGCLLPLLAAAQTTEPVNPVYSSAYQSLIREDSNLLLLKDSSNSLKKSRLRITDPFYGNTFRTIQYTGTNNIRIVPANQRTLLISGIFNSIAEWRSPNRKPALQHKYVQGRNNNGTLQWNGPDTDELFSYGPLITALEFDGSSYAWDPGGKLVTAGSGNGKAARSYNNNILRSGFLHTQSIQVNTRLEKQYSAYLALRYKGGLTKESAQLIQQKNSNSFHSAFAEWAWKSGNLKAGYNWQEDKNTRSNRNGLLNNIYKNSLLSPVSFSTRAVDPVLNWSRQTSNPFFLLNNPEKGAGFEQHRADMNLSQGFRNLNLYLTQSIENNRQYSNESIQPQTTGFPAGLPFIRNQHDKNFILKTGGNYRVDFTNSDFRLLSTLNYLFTDNRTVIDYPRQARQYNYHRSAHDLTMVLSPSFSSYNTETGIHITQKWMYSSTSPRTYGLTSASAYHHFRNLFDNAGLRLKLTGSYNRFNSELPFSRSYAPLQLLSYRPETYNGYLPANELKNLDGLLPAEHREWQTGMEFQAGRKWSVNATWFNRNTQKEIYPYLQNNELYAANLADQYYRGVELELRYFNYTYKKFPASQSHTAGFSRYRSRVTAIRNGSGMLPIAGFSNIYKALIPGQAPGVITGEGWQRNNNGQQLIGADGFPLPAAGPVILGNPMPDFVLKFSHLFTYKAWSLNFDWEWKKGGESWNGTQAMLDYYGRSAQSGKQRTITGYVFDGVISNGQHNTKAVDFFNPALPFAENRWVRYGPTGVAEAYIQRADHLRISNLGISWKKGIRKYLREIAVMAYINNLLLWTPYSGADPEQLLFGIPGTQGLDFFNLPAQGSGGITLTLQF